MTGDCQVRFRGSPGVGFPRATRLPDAAPTRSSSRWSAPPYPCAPGASTGEPGRPRRAPLPEPPGRCAGGHTPSRLPDARANPPPLIGHPPSGRHPLRRRALRRLPPTQAREAVFSQSQSHGPSCRKALTPASVPRSIAFQPALLRPARQLGRIREDPPRRPRRSRAPARRCVLRGFLGGVAVARCEGRRISGGRG